MKEIQIGITDTGLIFLRTVLFLLINLIAHWRSMWWRRGHYEKRYEVIGY